jgi:osmotically-inducible protein OsmY
MADNQRNQRRDRSWDQNRNSSQFSSDQDRDYGNHANMNGDRGYNSRYGQQHDEGNFGNQWNRESNYERSNYGSGRYNRDYNSGNNEDNFGYGGREYGSNYGGGNYQGSSSYYSNGMYGSTRPTYGNSRNLYDREYEGYNRDFNSGYSGLGGANYGNSYEDRGRRLYEQNRNYSGYGNSDYGRMTQDRNQRYGTGDSNERGWWDRTRDEVSSWFGDDDAERRRDRDKQQNYRGKGPRNYNRSDDRIKEDVNDRLSDDPWVDATEISVTVNNGEVTLTGTVNQRSDKRRAEDIAEAVSGVKNVENRLRITTQNETRADSGSPTGSMSGSISSEQAQTGTSNREPQSRDVEKNKAKAGYVTG